VVVSFMGCVTNPDIARHAGNRPLASEDEEDQES
jgi:hypothetical protein